MFYPVNKITIRRFVMKTLITKPQAGLSGSENENYSSAAFTPAHKLPTTYNHKYFNQTS